jgi:hypothetical protein
MAWTVWAIQLPIADEGENLGVVVMFRVRNGFLKVVLTGCCPDMILGRKAEC